MAAENLSMEAVATSAYLKNISLDLPNLGDEYKETLPGQNEKFATISQEIFENLNSKRKATHTTELLASPELTLKSIQRAQQMKKSDAGSNIDKGKQSLFHGKLSKIGSQVIEKLNDQATAYRAMQVKRILKETGDYCKMMWSESIEIGIGFAVKGKNSMDPEVVCVCMYYPEIDLYATQENVARYIK